MPRLRRRLGRPPRASAPRVPVPGRGAGRDEHQDGADANGVNGERGEEREKREKDLQQQRN